VYALTELVSGKQTGIIDYYRELVEEQRAASAPAGSAAARAEAATITFRAPDGLSNIFTMSGRHINIGIDRLACQICTTVDWAACLESCRAAEAGVALELGPGTALSRMAAPFFPVGFPARWRSFAL
jgi:malonyl CoA-acyl carrier protein transacylase